MHRQLGIEITHHFTGTTLSEKEFNKLTDIVSWKQVPSFPQRGRMAWHVFQEQPLLLDGSAKSLKAAKIKGVGGFNPHTEAHNRDPIYHKTTSEPFQPTLQPLSSFATYPHLGFREDGEYDIVYGSVAPIGGILHERAVAEYRCALHLLRHKVPAIVPLAVFRYEDSLKFHRQEMGVVVCFSPAEYPNRLSEVQYGAALRRGNNPVKDEYYDNIRQALSIPGDPRCEKTRLRTLNEIATRVGSVIHDFSYSGLYRYSAELPNFEFDFNECEVVLTDLDSTRFLSELPVNHQRLQVLRDMASMIYHFMAKFATPLALGHYTLKNLLTFDPITELIAGYFPGALRSEVEVIAKKLWNVFIPHFMLINKNRAKINSVWDNERRRSYKMDHDLFFILAMTMLYPIFCKSDLGEKYPDETLTQNKMMEKAGNYLGERCEYFEYAMYGCFDYVS